MNDYKTFNDMGIEKSWEELYEDNTMLTQENQQLRIQISAREEEYKKLEDNWNELKKMIEKTIIAINELSREPDSEFNCTMKGTLGRVLNMMDELEKSKSE